ncbi:MAG: hypothetical protein QM750_11760 [Rubrivivax sp.]
MLPAPSSPPSGLVILTPWLIPDPADPSPQALELDAVRDQLFRARVEQLLQQLAPWLIPILGAANAKLAAIPGKLLVVLGEQHPEPIEIPGIGEHLLLLPWQEPGQTPQ